MGGEQENRRWLTLNPLEIENSNIGDIKMGLSSVHTSNPVFLAGRTSCSSVEG